MNRKHACLFLISTLVIFPLFAGENVPRRIISCSPNVTEILYELGLEDSVVGVTDFCRFPPRVRKKERIGGFLNPSLEKIIELRPELVIVPVTKSGPLLPKLDKLEIPVLKIPNETIEDLLKGISLIARKTGVPGRGKILKRRIESQLAALGKQYRGNPRAKALIVVARSHSSLKDLYAASENTFLNELLIAAGGRNVLTRETARYPKISKESLVAMNPEVIIDATFSGQDLTTDALRMALEPWKTLPSLDAVKSGRVHIITDPSITILGPRVVESIQTLAKYLHNKPEGELLQ